MSILNYFRRKAPQDRGACIFATNCCYRQKNHLKSKFTLWYADQVKSQLAEGKAIDEIKISMRMSIIKPISANWYVYAYDCIGNAPDIIINGFCKAGIVNALDQ